MRVLQRYTYQTMKNWILHFRGFRAVVVISFLVLTAHVSTFAQGLHYIQTKPRSGEDAIRYLSHQNVNVASEILLLLPPMGCPRCEGVINIFTVKLKRLFPEVRSTLLAFYPLEDACRLYLKRRRFLFNRELVITTDSFLNFFSISTGTLEVPIFVRMDMVTGQVLNQMPCIGVEVNDSLVRDFMSVNKDYTTIPISGKSSQTAIKLKINKNNTNKFPLNILIFTGRETINSGKFKFSKLYDLNFLDGLFSAVDDLTLSILLFEKKDSSYQLQQIISQDDKWNNPFIDKNVPDTLVSFLEKINLVNTMYFKPQIISEEKIAFTASLPKIWWENQETEELAYENKIVFGVFTPFKKEIEFYPIVHNDTIEAKHTQSYFLKSGQYVIVPIKRGWPTSGNTLLPDPNDSLNNPFVQKFYNFSPEMALFTLSGKFIKYMGRLPKIYEVMHTGYACHNLLFGEDKDNLYVLESLTGELSTYSLKDFEIIKKAKLSNMVNNYSGLTCKSLPDIITFKKSFNETYTDIVPFKSYIVTLSHQNENKYVKIYNQYDGAIVNEYFVPQQFNGSKIKNLIIERTLNEVIVKALIQTDQTTYFLKSDNLFNVIK